MASQLNNFVAQRGLFISILSSSAQNPPLKGDLLMFQPASARLSVLTRFGSPVRFNPLSLACPF